MPCGLCAMLRCLVPKAFDKIKINKISVGVVAGPRLGGLVAGAMLGGVVAGARLGGVVF